METSEMERELYCPVCGEDLSYPEHTSTRMNDCCVEHLYNIEHQEEEYYEDDYEELNFDDD